MRARFSVCFALLTLAPRRAKIREERRSITLMPSDGLLVRYERREEHHQAFLDLGCALIRFNALQRLE